MDISKQVTLEDEPADVTLDTPAGPITVTVEPFNGPGHYVLDGRFFWDTDEDGHLEVDVWPPVEWDAEPVDEPEFPVRGGCESMWTAPRTGWYRLG